MCHIRVRNLPFFASFLAAIIWTVAPTPVNSERPNDYFENILTTPEISFAHISNDNNSNIKNEGQWTKEHRCHSGTFITGQLWFFNATNKNILGLIALCTEPWAEKLNANAIGHETIPSEKLKNDPSVITIVITNEIQQFANGFTMSTCIDGGRKRVSIGARQLLIFNNIPRHFEVGGSNCTNYNLTCKAGFRICGFQAKFKGDDGPLGGSITRMRFRCCYFCAPSKPLARDHRNINSVNRPQVYNYSGTYGYRSEGKPSQRVMGDSSLDYASPPLYKLMEPCNALFPSDPSPTHYPSTTPDPDYPSYDYNREATQQHEICGESEIVDITGSFNASTDTWEGFFKELAMRSGNRRRREVSKEKRRLEETRPYDKTMERLLEKLKEFKNVETPGDPSKNNIMSKNQTEIFVCELGHKCIIRQNKWKCDDYYIENPAFLIKEPVQSKNASSGTSEDGWVTGFSFSKMDASVIDSNGRECPQGMFIRGHEHGKGNHSTAEFKQQIKLDCTGFRAGRPLVIGYRFRKTIHGEDFVYEPLFSRTVAAPSSDKRSEYSDSEAFCPPEHAVCGLKYSDQTTNETTTRSFRFKCCYYCVPEEHIRTVNATQNNENGPSKFQFRLHAAQNSSANQNAHVLHIFSDWFGNNSVSGYDWIRQEVVGYTEEKLMKTHTYKCPARHWCTARQLIGQCGKFVIPTTNYTVEEVPLPGFGKTSRMIQKNVKSEDSRNIHFIFSYGLSREEETELLCPVGSVATGMRVKSETGVGMTGLEMVCSHLMPQSALALYTKSETLKDKLLTDMGKWEAQNPAFSRPLSGFSFNWAKGKPHEGFNVSFGALSKPEDARPDDETKFCPDHQKICGFNYRTDTKAEVIKELRLKCCPHCIPEEKWEPVELLDNLAGVTVGLFDMNSVDKNQTIDFETGSILQKLFYLRLNDGTVQWSRAHFDRPALAFVPRPKCPEGDDKQDGKYPCQFEQLVVVCEQYKVYTAKVKAVKKGAWRSF